MVQKRAVVRDFYEQHMVRDQLNQLTGRAPIGGHSDDSRYKELVTNGISFAQQYDLRPDIALSADQISHPTSDIVWMETQTVNLPDGTVENATLIRFIDGKRVTSGSNANEKEQKNEKNDGRIDCRICLGGLWN